MKMQKAKKIVRTVGTILLEDMQSMAYGTIVFPPNDGFYNEAEEMVP